MAEHPRDVELHIVDGGEDEAGFNDTTATEQPGFDERLVPETRRQYGSQKGCQRDNDASR